MVEGKVCKIDALRIFLNDTYVDTRPIKLRINTFSVDTLRGYLWIKKLNILNFMCCLVVSINKNNV